MQIEEIRKASFAVIGKEGSTSDGDGFIPRLWEDANAHFEQIADLVIRDTDGVPAGIWGLMSDPSRSFRPWDDFKNGLYLAGAECPADAEAPEGWVKWVVPGFVYLRAESEGSRTFPAMLGYLKENGFSLAGAVHDYTCLKTGKNYMYFPIRRL